MRALWESDVEMLGVYSRIDLHHVVGRSYDPDLVVYLCHNCHALAHSFIKHMGFDLSPPYQRNFLETLVRVLRAIGCTLQDWGKRLMRYAEQLAALIERLDTDLPSWRALPEAQL